MGERVRSFDVYSSAQNINGKDVIKWGIMDGNDSSKIYTKAIYDDLNGIYGLQQYGFASVKLGDRWIFIGRDLKQIPGTETYDGEAIKRIFNKVINSKIDGVRDRKIKVRKIDGEDQAVNAILNAIGRNSDGRVIQMGEF